MSGVFDPSCGSQVTLSGNRVSLCRARKANKTSFSFRKREGVEGFSKSSGYRMQAYLRSCVADYRSLGTLTFDDCPDGKTAKLCLGRFFKRVRRAYANQPDFSLFWFLEFQKRGSIHFHFFTTVFIPKAWLSRAWLESCESSHKKCQTNIKGIRSGRYGTGKYAQKYAQKAKQKVLPENFGFVGRWWGKIGKTDMAAATIKISFEHLLHAEIGQKVFDFAKYVEKGVAEGWIHEREVTKQDELTGERLSVGVTLWEVRAGFRIRDLVRLFNLLIDEPEKRLKYQKGWICGKQVRQGGALRSP